MNERIIIIYESNALYTDPLVLRLMQEYKGQVKAVMRTKGSGYNPNLIFAKEFVVLMVKNVLASIKNGWAGNTVSRESSLNMIPYHRIQSVNSRETRETISSIKPTIIISLVGQIYTDETIRAFNCDILNKHCSLLPSYRGVLPVFWQIKTGAEKTGITLHKIQPGKIDLGEMISQQAISFRGKSVHEIYAECHQCAYRMIVDYVETKNTTRMIATLPSYYSHPRFRDVIRFRSAGDD